MTRRRRNKRANAPARGNTSARYAPGWVRGRGRWIRIYADKSMRPQKNLSAKRLHAARDAYPEVLDRRALVPLSLIRWPFRQLPHHPA